MSPKKWTKERVIKAIQDRHRRGVSLIAVRRTNPALASAAARYLGSWGKAMSAAGFGELVRKQHRWTKQRVIDAIRDRHRRGLSLTSVWREDGPLYSAAKYRLVSWQRAISAAGASGAWPHRTWSKQCVVRAILARHHQGASLNKTWEEDRVLYDAAFRRFKSWPRALVAAGLKEFAITHRKWTRQAVLEAIRARHARGLPLTSVGKHDVRLYAAALRHFDSWHEAVRAAGLEPIQHGWSKKRVIETIQDRYIRGLPLGRFPSRELVRLQSAARRCFGCWSSALAAAGLGRDGEVQ